MEFSVRRVLSGVCWGALLAAIIGLALSLNGCSMPASRSDLRSGLAPVSESVADVKVELASLRKDLNSHKADTAQGIRTLAEGQGLLADHIGGLRRKVEDVEGRQSIRFQRVEAGLEKVRAESRKATRAVTTAQEDLTREVRQGTVRVQGELLTLHEGQEFHEGMRATDENATRTGVENESTHIRKDISDAEARLKAALSAMTAPVPAPVPATPASTSP